jgi:hypothetical protein
VGGCERLRQWPDSNGMGSVCRRNNFWRRQVSKVQHYWLEVKALSACDAQAGMLRSHFPGHFKPEEWLGDFIIRIRNASDSDGLFHAKADLPEIEAINEYSKKYHHDQLAGANK